MVSYYPVSIPAHSMALNVTVQSYNGRLDYGLIACRRALPDVNDLADGLLAEHRVLLDLAKAQTPALAPSALVELAPPAKRKAVTQAAPTKPKRTPAKRVKRQAAAS